VTVRTLDRIILALEVLTIATVALSPLVRYFR